MVETEEEKIEPGDEDFLGPEILCLRCVMKPCLCELRQVELKLEMLKLKDKINQLEDEEINRRKIKTELEIDENSENSDASRTIPSLMQHNSHMRGRRSVALEKPPSLEVQPLPHRGGGEAAQNHKVHI